MAELLIGLLITAFLNTIWHTKDPHDQLRYWSNTDETAEVWNKIDSTILVSLDSTHFDYLDEEYIDDVILIPRTKADSARAGMVQPDTLQLDGL